MSSDVSLQVAGNPWRRLRRNGDTSLAAQLEALGSAQAPRVDHIHVCFGDRDQAGLIEVASFEVGEEEEAVPEQIHPLGGVVGGARMISDSVLSHE